MLFSQAFKEAFSKKFWGIFSSSIGGAISFFAIGKTFFGLGADTSALYASIVCISIWILRFLYALSKLLYNAWQTKSKVNIYGDAIIFLAEAYSRVNWIKKNDPKPETLLGVMVFVCEHLKTLYSKKTKATCSVSIKVVVERTDEQLMTARVKNFCRDKQSAKIRDTDEYSKTKHLIIGNTCYNTILSQITKKRKSYYLNNDIINTKNYENTSLEVYGGKLPYNSEIVVPILPMHFEADKTDEGQLISPLGFICIDCEKGDVFDSKYDVAILECIADGIYDVLDNVIN